MSLPRTSRRTFLKRTALAGAALLCTGPFTTAGAAVRRRNLKLGFDNFSIRAFGWKAPRLLEYASSMGVDTVLFSDLDVYESHDPAYLRDVAAEARRLGIEIQAGTGSICPTSSAFNPKWGTAEEHLALALRVGAALGSDVVRCYLGRAEDRKSPGGIEARIADTVAVLKTGRRQALDAGIRIAVENHAGDMQGRELVTLIDAAGPEYVGATLDSGNATWTLEAPLANLEVLGPYAVSSGIRDSMIWKTPEGARVQWTAVGDGQVDWNAYMDRWEQLCPNAPVQMEIISGFSVAFPYLTPGFWNGYEQVRAEDFARFAAMAERGEPLEGFRAPEGAARAEAEQAYQKAELEKSIRYCKEVLGLGLRS